MRNLLIYVIIFLATLLFAGGFWVYYYYYYAPSLVQEEMPFFESYEGFDVADSTGVEEEELSEIKRRDQQALDELVRANMPEHERHFLELMEQVRALNMRIATEDRNVAETDRMTNVLAEMDSTIIVMIAQNDSLKSVIIHHLVEINVLRDRNSSLNEDIARLDETILSLQETIYELRDEIEILLTPPVIEEEEEIEEEIVLDFRQLARLYNDMDNARVTLLLQRLEPEQAVAVLRLMNRRKVAQIMGLLPQNVAAEYSQLLLVSN